MFSGRGHSLMDETSEKTTVEGENEVLGDPRKLELANDGVSVLFVCLLVS